MFLALEIHPYGVMIAIGILVCFAMLWVFEKCHSIDHKFMDFVNTNAIAAIILGFVCAAAFQALYNFIENPEKGFVLNAQTGITFIGGLMGGALTFIVGYLIFKKKYNTKLIDIMYFLPSCIIIAHAFGRIGCYFGQCCYGVHTDSWIGVHINAINDTRLPTHLFEACFLFLLFGVTFFLAYKKKFLYNMPLYLATYGIWRFFIEFYRGDHRGEFVGGISPSQFWSILMVVAAVPLGFLLYYFNKKRQQELSAIEEKPVDIEIVSIEEK